MIRQYQQRTRITDAATLARYLPPDVVAPLLAPGATHAANQVYHLERLETLLQAVVAYIPAYARTDRDQAAAISTTILRPSGSVLSADLSGFTAFSARLSTLGVEGAEVLARVISALFDALVGEQERWNGVLLKLSGDALTAFFSGSDHAQHAASAALAMQSHMEAFGQLATPLGSFTLQLRIGLATGPVVLAEVGSSERRELLVAGTTAQRAVAMQRDSAPGAVLIDSATYRALADCVALNSAPDRYQLRAVAPTTPPQPATPRYWQRTDPFWELQSVIQRLEAARPYLIHEHFAMLCNNTSSFSGESDLRSITVLFAFVSDATALIEQPDAGAALTLVQQRTQEMWDTIARYGGVVNKLDIHAAGHTLVVLFGAPLAQGDDADRAVFCAQALLQMAAAHTAMPDSDGAFLVRQVGIASGRVFAGAVGSPTQREYTVMGATVNMAARLMDLADNGAILLDQATAAATRGRFRLQPQPPMLVKGYAEPVALFRAIDEARSRLAMLLNERGPLFGREAELAQGRSLIAGALAGRGRMVLLVGEPGIGKTRLLAALTRTLPVAPGPLIATVQAQPQMRSQPYALIVALLHQLYDVGSPNGFIDALRERVDTVAPAQARFLPVLLALLAVQAETALTKTLTPDERRSRLHDLIVALLLAEAQRMPVALLLEDLHWCDAASLELLALLVSQGTHLPLLLLATSRPAETLSALASAAATIMLAGLPDEQAALLLDQALGERALSADTRAAVLERTQGNPLFLAETARALIEQPQDRGETPLPLTVQSALQVRLDMLNSEDRVVLRVAAVIGPRFRAAILGDIGVGGSTPVAALDRLVQHGFLQLDADAHDGYAFTHSLVQETAYANLLFAQRRPIHRQVADWLRVYEPASSGEQAGLLAFHYGRAEAWPEALEYSWQAGQAAQALYAGEVALAHYGHALDAAARLGEEVAHWPQVILPRCGDIHALNGRYDAATDAYRVALAAATDNQQRALILLGWAEIAEQQGAFDDALALLDQAAQARSELPADPLALRARVHRGWLLARQGNTDAARAAIEPTLEQLETQSLWRDLLLAYRTFFLLAHGQAHWSQARAFLRLALHCAQQLGDIRETARIENNLGAVAGQEGRLSEAIAALEHAAQVFSEIGDNYNLASVQLNLGAIMYKQGDYGQALNHYQASLDIATGIGDTQTACIVHSNLGELCRRTGDQATSLDHLARCIALAHQLDDGYGLAEAYMQQVQTYLELAQLGAARTALDQANVQVQAVGDPQLEAIFNRVTTLVLLEYDDPAGAFAAISQSVHALGKLGNRHDLAQSLVVQAQVLLATRQDKAAATLLQEAIRLFGQTGAVADEQRARGLLVRATISQPLEEFQR